MTLPQSEDDLETISEAIKSAGVAGAGGAGFPSYKKWESLANVDHLLMNHQESEPILYTDKWLAREYSDAFEELFESLLGTTFESVVVGTKKKYCEEWTGPLETVTDPTIYQPEDLPVDTSCTSGISFAYTPDIYTYSEEKVLLNVAAGEQIGEDLPTEHGWIVHNTETLFNIYQALKNETPVTRKYVHIDGNTPNHRCLDVPVGTPAPVLLEAAGIEKGKIDDNHVLADGGPGWCYEIEVPIDEFGVRKRTNGLIVIDEKLARKNREDDGEIDVLDTKDWDREHEMEPTRLNPDRVRIPLITNEAYRGFVGASEPIVESGDTVSEGQLIAVPKGEISNPQHASISGTVTEVTNNYVGIERL
jgi:electron transport complex protein RnfC